MNYAIGSRDEYLKTAAIQLAATRDLDQMLYWTKVGTDVCANRVLRPSTVVIQAPPVPTEPPVPPPGSGHGGLPDALDRASQSTSRLTESLNELNAAMIETARAAKPTVSSWQSAVGDTRTGQPAGSQPPRRPISESEAQLQVRGSSSAKGPPTPSRQKAYGAGWVTVCE
jgi:hypothetical protein